MGPTFRQLILSLLKTENRHSEPNDGPVTAAAKEAGALVSFDASECELVDLLTETGAFRSAVDGFGSSDCRRCTSHLLTPLQNPMKPVSA